MALPVAADAEGIDTTRPVAAARAAVASVALRRTAADLFIRVSPCSSARAGMGGMGQDMRHLMAWACHIERGRIRRRPLRTALAALGHPRPCAAVP
ncbi:hypothetical protein GCM10027162_22290 [Streptomyces incanus]